MNIFKPKYLARNCNAGYLLEIFLVSSIASVLGIRVFLQITGFPTISGGNIHIAHILWGGILMLIALVLLFTYLNKEVRSAAAIIGGVGFGAFIDELGKFITKDNNYFYEPAIAIIYVVFILLFFLFRHIERATNLTKKEYAVNAIEVAKEIVLHDLDKEEKNIALEYINKSDQNETFVIIVKNAIKKFEALPVQQTYLTKIRQLLRNSYKKIVKNPKFATATIWFFSIYSIVNFIPSTLDLTSNRGFSEWGLFLSSALTTFYVLVGIYLMLERNRLASFEMYKLAILVSIFLTQFFLFFKQQVGAVFGLGANLVIFSTLQYLINQEKASK